MKKFQSMSIFCQRNTETAMSNVYAKRFEAVFLCTHPKGPKMSYAMAAKYIKKSKAFVENVWAYIKQKLRGKRAFTLKQLCREIQRIWRALPLEYAENLVDSMPRRCQAIIDAGGDWTSY